MPLLNLRDVATATGIRPGVLYRSAQPDALSADDLVLVGGLKLIADLRDDYERDHAENWPPNLAAGVRVLRLGDGSREAPAGLAGLSLDIGLPGLYLAMLERRRAWLAGVLAQLADGLPALVHCAAGKDRTGVVIALVLDLVGVDHELVVADYRQTTVALPAVGAMLNRDRANQAPASLHGVSETAIRAFLAALAEAGGAGEVLRPHGLTAEHVDRLRTALVG